MRILYVAYRYDYGKPERGLSFEHYNFYESLVAMGHEVDYFDIGSLLMELGRERMNALLRDRVARTSPDLMFTCIFEDELDPDVVAEITRAGDTPTFNWFCDDHWRFETFTSRWAPCFSWASTTADSALPKYAALGYRNVIKTQWAAADSLYHPHDLPLAYDVTFVGQAYGDRPEVIARLRAAGIPVRAWGTGWSVSPVHRALARLPVVRSLGGRRLRRLAEARTRCSQDEMLDIFEQSRVNLNLVEASQGDEPQIKGRTFEVPACGGLLLDGPTAGIEEYFTPGEEIVVYRSFDEMVERVRYLLSHESERAAIAAAGHRRVMAEHTYRARFTEIFRTMGLD